mgnify:CR=1 FL=1
MRLSQRDSCSFETKPSVDSAMIYFFHTSESSATEYAAFGATLAALPIRHHPDNLRMSMSSPAFLLTIRGKATLYTQCILSNVNSTTLLREQDQIERAAHYPFV